LPVKVSFSVTGPSGIVEFIVSVCPSTEMFERGPAPWPVRSMLPVYAPGEPEIVKVPPNVVPSGATAVYSKVPTGLRVAGRAATEAAGGGVGAGAAVVVGVDGVALGLVAQASESGTSSSTRCDDRGMGPLEGD
jgi:hypothetical protein